jgi:hypothetical protein
MAMTFLRFGFHDCEGRRSRDSATMARPDTTNWIGDARPIPPAMLSPQSALEQLASTAATCKQRGFHRDHPRRCVAHQHVGRRRQGGLVLRLFEL